MKFSSLLLVSAMFPASALAFSGGVPRAEFSESPALKRFTPMEETDGSLICIDLLTGETGRNRGYLGECGDLEGEFGTRVELKTGRWPGGDLTRPDAKLDGLNLRRAILGSANLDGASLRGANLSLVDAEKVALTGADLSGADLTRINASKGVFARAWLIRTRLEGAYLDEADLTEADLRDADLKRALMKQARLPRAVLAGARLDHVILEGADLSGANLRGARLFKTDLTSAKLPGADLRAADLSGAWAFAAPNFKGALIDANTRLPMSLERAVSEFGMVVVEDPSTLPLPAPQPRPDAAEREKMRKGRDKRNPRQPVYCVDPSTGRTYLCG